MFALVSGGCSKQGDKDGDEKATTSAEDPDSGRGKSTEAPKTKLTNEEVEKLNHKLLDHTATCRLSYGGPTLDLGDPSREVLRSFRFSPPEKPIVTGREGESFLTLTDMDNDFVFWVTDELKEFELSARVFGAESERVAFYLDKKRLGAASLKADEIRTVRISAKDHVLSPGRHTLTVSLSRGRSKRIGAEVSWIQFGRPGARESDFPATRREIFSEVTLGETRKASVVLRESASVRCPLFVPPNAQLSASVGVWGAGAAELEVVVHSQKGDSRVVASARRAEDESRDYEPLSADLSEYASEIVDLELRAVRGSRGARLCVAEPQVTVKAESFASSPRAARAIVISLSGLSPRHAPPSAGRSGLPVLNELAALGTVYRDYRLTSTSATANIASLLTGSAPYEHGLSDSRHALSVERRSIAGLVEAQGGRSAYFTGVPTGFAEFGFAQGFETFESFPPQADLSAVEPLDRAQKWLSGALKHEGPVFVMIQLRGAHPPFDVSREEAQELAPKEYGGDLSPRRAAIQIAEIRGRALARHRVMPEEDWTRLFALEKAALLRQNAALSSLLDFLRKSGAYDDTLLIVTGDLGSKEPPDFPFGYEGSLDETLLSVPLLIKHPGGHLSARHIEGYFAPRDVTLTVLKSLGLAGGVAKDAINLASGLAREQAEKRPHIAYQRRTYSLRAGDALLSGEEGKMPKLCLPHLDPACLMDRADAEFLRTHALFTFAWSTLASAEALTKNAEGGPDPEQDEITEKPELENALTVWGHRR